MGFGFVTDVANTAARFGWASNFSYVIGVLHRTQRPDSRWLFRRGDPFFPELIESPATFPKIFDGTHVNRPEVRVVRGKSATVRTSPSKELLPDGEIFGTTPATFSRRNLTEAIKTLEHAARVMQSGTSIVILPEGHRTLSDGWNS